MKKILLFLVFCLGITVFYSKDNGIGWVYVNNSPYDATFIVSERDNTVNVMSSGRLPAVMTYTEWLRDFGGAVIAAGKSPKSIILPATKETSGISH